MPWRPAAGVGLELLFREHATALLRLAVVLTGDALLAEELVQEAFVRYHRARARPAPGAERAYLRRIVINLSHTHHRRVRAARRRAPDPPGDVTPADEEVLRRGGARQVADAVRALPVRQRDCVVLRSYAGEGAPAAGRRPEVVALAREDGVLLTVDLATGEQRALRSEGNPADSPGNGAPGYINWVDLSPDGRWVYFSRCCEPGSGETYRIPVEGGTVESIDDGSYPRVSPDGRWVAVSDISLLRVVPADGGGDPVTVDTGVFPTDMVWSPDGTELAAILRGPEAGEHRLAIYRFDGSILTPAESRMSDASTRFVVFEPDPGAGWVGISGVWDDDRSVSQDVSYEWALAVDQDGVVVEQHGFTEGVITPVPGLPAALAADW